MSEFHSGFVAMVGRPNVGKSTLTNALVGEKVAITSSRPETTRRAIRGILERDDYQVVLVDTPGLHRPRTLLGQRLNDMVHEALADVDAVCVCLPADQEIGPGDRFLLKALPRGVRRVAAVTKIDRVKKDAVAAKLIAVDAESDWAGIVPVSAVNGWGVEELARVLGDALPVGPRWYPEGARTDEPLEVRIAELVREAALEGVRDELPHSVAVLVDDVDYPAEGEGVIHVRVSLYVERDSQKGIIIGKKGAHLKQIGTKARPQIESLVGGKVFLDIHVKVAKDWQRDPKLLGRLGF
jgi:GTP-binding protein Era